VRRCPYIVARLVESRDLTTEKTTSLNSGNTAAVDLIHSPTALNIVFFILTARFRRRHRLWRAGAAGVCGDCVVSFVGWNGAALPAVSPLSLSADVLSGLVDLSGAPGFVLCEVGLQGAIHQLLRMILNSDS
jgi:hypothetical protein